jgi:hypothetical protein
MLSEAERGKVLYHLDYALLSQPTTLDLGLPIVTQARFMVEQNMLRLDPGREPLVRTVIARLDCIIAEKDAARRALVMVRTGETEFRAEAQMLLDQEYDRERRRLADMLGAQLNPVSNQALGGYGGVVEGC